MIKFKNIPSTELDERFKRLDDKTAFIYSKFGISLKSYGNFIRVAINSIQSDAIEDLIERVNINRELERALDNVGGYTLDDIEENNPKAELLALFDYLRVGLFKQIFLFKFLNETNSRTVAVFDNNDIDFAQGKIRNRKVEIITFSELKKWNTQNKTLVFHSFNGQKDFDDLYNRNNEICLVVYKQEKNLYHKYLDQRKKLIEQEIKSEDRFNICRIEYKEARNNVTDISSSISDIVSRLDQMSKRAYEGYKIENDILLNETDEHLIYKITTDKEILLLESNDTIFKDNGNLIKAYQIKQGNKIRIYPKQELAENLYQVAVDTEPDVFGKVEEHSRYWKEIIGELREKYGDDRLYEKLKEKGLRVLQATLDTYGGDRDLRKFPMFNNDLRAIFKLYFQDKPDNEIDNLLIPVLKSKTTYNSTMIVLGRGLKQELRLFLKEREIGEILRKRNFNENTLKAFIDEFMPIHTVIKKEVFEQNLDTIEESTLELFEL